MAESSDVLNGLIIVYTCYAVVIISLIAWFGYKISRKGEGKLIRPGLFYTWVGFLVVLGVSLHIFTYNTIPWAPMDLNRVDIKPDTVIYITVADHEFRLPGEKITLKKDQKVLFDVTSMDLTYGFGLFDPIIPWYFRCRSYQVIRMIYCGNFLRRVFLLSVPPSIPVRKEHIWNFPMLWK